MDDKRLFMTFKETEKGSLCFFTSATFGLNESHMHGTLKQYSLITQLKTPCKLGCKLGCLCPDCSTRSCVICVARYKDPKPQKQQRNQVELERSHAFRWRITQPLHLPPSTNGLQSCSSMQMTPSLNYSKMNIYIMLSRKLEKNINEFTAWLGTAHAYKYPGRK